MKTTPPTPFPDVKEILDLLHTNVKEILQDHFVGMYLFGSLANGDFDQYSDIDVLVVTHAEITSEAFSALQIMHKQINEIDSPWANQLEVSYIPRNALRRFDPRHKLHPHLDRGTGETLHMMEHESDWIVQRHTLRERGVTLDGPPPKSLIDAVSADDLRRAVVNVLPLWVKPLVDDPIQQIRPRGYQSFIVLSLCRMLYTIQEGTIASKPVAAQWALKTLSAEWRPLIERAIIGRQNAGLEAQAEDLAGTIRLIRYTLDRIGTKDM